MAAEFSEMSANNEIKIADANSVKKYTEQQMIECFNAGYSNGHIDTGMNALYYINKLKK